MRNENFKTSHEKAFYAIRDDIVEGRILPGSKLNEESLSTKYGVSRAIIREALNRLQSISLIEHKANVGSRVVSISISGFIQLYQVRESLEGMAARLAAINMSEQERAQLTSLLDTHKNKVSASESYYQEAGDVDFHYNVVKGSHNSHLIGLLLDNVYHSARMYRVQYGMHGSRVSTALDEHIQIGKAICAQDPELAEILMRRHISNSMKNIQQKLEATE